MPMCVRVVLTADAPGLMLKNFQTGSSLASVSSRTVAIRRSITKPVTSTNFVYVSGSSVKKALYETSSTFLEAVPGIARYPHVCDGHAGHRADDLAVDADAIGKVR